MIQDKKRKGARLQVLGECLLCAIDKIQFQRARQGEYRPTVFSSPLSWCGPTHRIASYTSLTLVSFP